MIIPFQIVIGGRGPGVACGLRATAAGRSTEASIQIPVPDGDPVAYGAALGQAVFVPAVRQLLLDVARGADDAGARIQIQLRTTPELAGLPWEWMSLGTETLWQPAIREDYTLVRVAQGAHPPPTLAVAAPLRLLIATAPGCGGQADALGAALAGEVRARRLIVDRLRDADPASLADALAEEPCHLLHLIAPAVPGLSGGPARAAQPRLRLGRSLDALALANILEDYPTLRMVTLSGNGPESVGPMTTLAVGLHQALGLAALSMGDLDGSHATDFCAACYAVLAAGEPVDLAVTASRAGLAEFGGLWGAPQLMLAAGGEELFRIGAAEPAPARAARPERRPERPERPAQPPATRRPAVPRQMRGRLDAAIQIFQPLARPLLRSPLRGRGAADVPPPRLSRRVIILIVASLILILMVGRSLRWPDSTSPSTSTTPTARVLPSPRGEIPAVPVMASGSDTRNVILADLTPTATVESPPTISPSAPMGNPLDIPPPTGFATYLAAEGDTIDGVALRAGSDPQAILALNRMAPGEPLRTGRPLVVPIYRAGEALPEAPVIVRGNATRPEVALTFDIEIDDRTLYAFLDILAARGIKGTFFVTGRWVIAYPDAARRIVAEGHEIGNHSLTHPFFTQIGMDGVSPELDKTEQLVREATGASTRPYFRFPYGASNQPAIDHVATDGYVPYHWSADDAAIPGWMNRATANPAQVYGEILLMHQRQSTVDSLAGWLDQIAALGLRPVTLGEAMR